MAWKILPADGRRVARALFGSWVLLAAAAATADPARLAQALLKEGRPEAAAIEFRRLALEADSPEQAARWYWWAAQAYAAAGQWEASNRMLDRSEDAAPDTLAAPTMWRRAENALAERDWPAAAFYFDSLRLKSEDDSWRQFAVRGAVFAHLRQKNLADARRAAADLPPAAAEKTRATIDHYARQADKKPWIGGVLGLVPGLGYAYSGEFSNAARSLILNSLFIWGMAETAEEEQWGLFAVLAFGEFTWYSGSIYGGIDAAHRHNQRRLLAAVAEIRGAPQPLPDPAQLPLVQMRWEW